MPNFHPTHNTADKFLGERYTRELMSDGLAWCTTNMSDEELRMAIIGDLVSYTMWEKEFNIQLPITFEELTRFVLPEDVERIRQQLEHEEIKHLFVFDNNVYRMKDDRAVLQAAMDFTGIWYETYVPPEGSEGIVVTNREVLTEAVEKYGSVDNLAKALAMDLETYVPGSSPFSIN